MRSVIAFAAMALVAAAVTPKLIGQMSAMKAHHHGSMAMEARSASTPHVSYWSRSVTIDPDREGHFHVRAEVDGRTLEFMIDTGASVVALKEEDAARLGPRPMPSDYTATVSTANGRVKAAPMQLDSVAIDGIELDHVRALVLPDRALGENLLGLSFLSRLSRYEYSDGKLVLEQ